MKKYRIYYAVYLCLAFLPAFIMQDKFTVSLLITILILPVLSAGMTFLASRKITVAQKLSQTQAIKGIPVQYSLKIKNNGLWFCPHMRLQFYEHDAVVFPDDCGDFNAVQPYTTITRNWTAQCVYRGAYPVGCQSIEIFDFFRIFCFRKKIKNPPVLFIYPYLHSIEGISFNLNTIQEEALLPSLAEDDYTEVSDFRSYTEQDSMKKIHWKLSSKKEELIVKKYSSFFTTNLAIALDLGQIQAQNSAALEDHMVEAAVSMVYGSVQQGQRLDFLYNTHRYETARIESASDFNRLYTASATMRFDSPLPFYGAISRYQQTHTGSLNLYILTAQVNFALYEQVKQTIRSGYNTTVIRFGKAYKNNLEQEALGKLFQEIHAEPVKAEDFFPFLR